MAGPGTDGLELVGQGDNTDAVLVPVGCGGPRAGLVTAIKETHPNIKIIGVEPECAKDTYLSLQHKKITPYSAKTIADGLRATQPGDLTFPVLMKYVDELVL